MRASVDEHNLLWACYVKTFNGVVSSNCTTTIAKVKIVENFPFVDNDPCHRSRRRGFLDNIQIISGTGKRKKLTDGPKRRHKGHVRTENLRLDQKQKNKKQQKNKNKQKDKHKRLLPWLH